MNFSIDTNIVFGIVNPKDRIHNESIELLQNRQKEHLFICHSAIRESKTTLRKNINEIVIEIFRFFPDIYKPDLGSIELQDLMIKEFKKLIISKPGKKNFLDWVYHKICTFLMTHDKEDLASYLSELSVGLSTSVEIELKETRPDYEEIILNFKYLEDIKKSVVGVYFKNPSDQQIFYELMTNLNKILPIEFISDDKEFKNKYEKGYTKIANDLKFDKGHFSCILLRDYITKNRA